MTIDGHSLSEIDSAFSAAQMEASSGRPSVILAKTIKGRGFSEVENKNGWHGKALPPEMAERAIAELGGIRNLVARRPLPEAAARGPVPDKPTTISLEPGRTAPSGEPPTHEVGKKSRH
jgi:transketolase